MNNDEKENKGETKFKKFLRVAKWVALVLVILFVVIPMAIGIYMNVAAPGLPEQLAKMVEACEERNEGCPDYLAKFRAFQQIYLADVEVANKFLPPDVELMSFFGLTPAALFVVEYSYHTYDDPPTPPAGNPGGPPEILYREVDVLLLAGTGPDGMTGAWASHVLVTHPTVRNAGRSIGLPAELAPNGITVKHNCGEDQSGIVFDIGQCGKKVGYDRVCGIDVCLTRGPGEGSMDLTELVNHTLPNITGRIAQDNKYVYGAAPHGPEVKLTDFMIYLFTFWKATVRLSDSVPQSVTGEGEAAEIMAALLKGPRLPFATVFNGVESTVWDILVRNEGKWILTKRPF